MPLRQFLNAAQQTSIGGNVSKGQIEIESLGIHYPRAGGIGKQSLELGRKDNGAAVATIEQRLLTRAIAGQQHAPSRSIVQRERKHPVQPAEAVVTPLEICLEYDLGIRRGAKHVLACFELTPDFLIVIDLAVEDDLEAVRRISHGLPAGWRQVNNREPPVPQRNQTVLRRPRTLIVGTAMAKGVPHLEQ